MPSTVLTLSVGTSSYFFVSPANALVSGGSWATVYDPGGGDGVTGVGHYNTNATQLLPSNAIILGVEITTIAKNDTYSASIGASISQVGNIPLTTTSMTQTFQSYKFGSSVNNLGATSVSNLQVVSVAMQTVYPAESLLDYVTATVFWEVPSLNVLFFGESF